MSALVGIGEMALSTDCQRESHPLTFSPSGELDGFDGWNAHAVIVEIAEGLSVAVAALDDVIASKRAANRPQDQMALPYLDSLRDQLG